MLLLYGVLAALLQQVPQGPAGSIEGTVTTTGAAPVPLAGAQVNVRLTPGPSAREFTSETTTDGAGRFSLQDVPPGLYVIEVRHDGYGYRPSMFTLTPARSLPVTVESGTRTQVPTIALTLAGTIRGSVVDKSGKGVEGVGVEFLRLTNDEDGRRIWRLVSSAVLTDSEGKYERGMLSPGDYYVRTTLENGPVRIPVYYPETIEAAAAAPIALSEGGQMTADIHIAAAVGTPSHKISGRVIRPDAEDKSGFVMLDLFRNSSSGPLEPLRPFATASVVLMKRRNDLPKGGDASEPFELQGVPAGRYYLVVNADIDGEEYSSKAEIYVGDGGSENTELVLRPSVEVKGRVVFDDDLPSVRVLNNGFEGDGRRARPQVGDIKLALNRKDGLPLGVSGPGGIKIAGRLFSIRDVPEGDYELSVGIESDGRPPGSSHYIEDVRLDGRSVFDTGFRVGLDPLDSLEVVVGTRGGSIQGKITGGESGLPASLILVPESFRRSNASLYRVLYLPRNAEFRMNGIAPGNYKLFAVPYLNETVPYRSTEFIARHESRAVSVTVQKGTMVEGVQAPYLALGR